jgi:hypothetical protein
MRLYLLTAFTGLLLAGVAPCFAQTGKPKLPPGTDPGGIAIAFLTTGVDYTRPEVARLLARDGEGDLIGWDFVSNGNRPYAVGPNGTPGNFGGDGSAFARLLGGAGAVRLIPIRVDPAQPSSLAQAVSFAARTPARLLLVPMWTGEASQWEPFREAAMKHPTILIVVPALSQAADRAPMHPASGLDNVLVVSDQGDAVADAHVDTTAMTGTAVPNRDNLAAVITVAFVHALAGCASGPAGTLEIDSSKVRKLTWPASMIKNQCKIRALLP